MKKAPSKPAMAILVLLILVFILAGLSLLLYFSAEHVSLSNPEDANGNTPGNLLNNGTFCEYGSQIYFSNSYDHGALYVMDTDLSNVRKLNADCVSSINVYGDYIYYTRNNNDNGAAFGFLKAYANALCRAHLDGSNTTVLDSDPSLNCALLGNYLYYVHYDQVENSTLYRIRIDREERAQVSKKAIVPSSVYGSSFYYTEPKDTGFLCQLSAISNSGSTVYEGTNANPIRYGSSIYFIDPQNDYCLSQINLADQQKIPMTSKRVDYFNISGNYIYLQINDGENSGIYKMSIDGSEATLLKSGIFTDINVTSNYVFFHDFNSETPIYMVKTGGNSVSIFQP